MDTESAARAWADGWRRGWLGHDVAPILALYADDAVFVSAPFREPKYGPEGVREYVEWAFSEEDAADPEFADPVTEGHRAVVEWRAVITYRGKEQTLAGASLIRFDDNGLVREQRDYWHMEDGRKPAAPGWGFS